MFIKKFLKNDDGSVIVIIALFVTVLIGMSALVLDLGMAYNAKSKLQKALDSTVLAATRELPLKNKNTAVSDWGRIINIAKHYAEDNGIENVDELEFYAIGSDNKNIATVNKDTYDLVKGIKVIGETEVNYGLATIINRNSDIVKGKAIAKLVDISGMSGLAPFVLTESQIDYIKNNPNLLITIKHKENKQIGEEPGWFGAVGIDGSGASIYEETFIKGSKKELFKGDKLNIENGNMVGPTRDGYYGRIAGHELCTISECKVDSTDSCPRKIIIPIVTIVKSGNNIDYLQITNFASVFIESFGELDENGYPVPDNPDDKNQHEGVLSVKYIDTIKVGSATADSGVVLNAYNVKAVKLID